MKWFFRSIFQTTSIIKIPTSDDDVVVSTEDVPGTDHFVSRIAYCIQSIPWPKESFGTITINYFGLELKFTDKIVKAIVGIVDAIPTYGSSEYK